MVLGAKWVVMRPKHLLNKMDCSLLRHQHGPGSMSKKCSIWLRKRYVCRCNCSIHWNKEKLLAIQRINHISIFYLFLCVHRTLQVYSRIESGEYKIEEGWDGIKPSALFGRPNSLDFNLVVAEPEKSTCCWSISIYSYKEYKQLKYFLSTVFFCHNFKLELRFKTNDVNEGKFPTRYNHVKWFATYDPIHTKSASDWLMHFFHFVQYWISDPANNHREPSDWNHEILCGKKCKTNWWHIPNQFILVARILKHPNQLKLLHLEISHPHRHTVYEKLCAS